MKNTEMINQLIAFSIFLAIYFTGAFATLLYQKIKKMPLTTYIFGSWISLFWLVLTIEFPATWKWFVNKIKIRD